MMKATGHKRCHTLTLLRHLREWGYVIPVGVGKGPRNFSSLRIPLNIFGNITPEPMTPEQIAEQRAKYARKKKRVDQADDADEEGQAQPDQAPASSPASKPESKPGVDQARPFPAVAAALSTAIMPMPEPIPITPPPVESPPLTPEQQEQQDIQDEIAAWEEKITYYRFQRDSQPELSAGWKRWNRHLERAVDAQNQWRQLALPAQAVAVLSIVEAPKGEYA